MSKKINKKSEQLLIQSEKRTDVNEPLHAIKINTKYGEKEISVYAADIASFKGNIDVLTTSAFIHSYFPTPKTIFEALYHHGIYAEELAKTPEIDLRNPAHIWLSKKISGSRLKILRIGCIEFDHYNLKQSILCAICSYFHMLDIASSHGVDMETVALPLLGSGSQHIDTNLIIVPLINECLSFLQRNPHVKKIYFIEKNPDKADFICNYMKRSYNILHESELKIEASQKKEKTMAFISHSSKDKRIADNLCEKLEARGLRVWYAPRDVKNTTYSEAITKAIADSSYFIVILSENSFQSQHVLNEIDLAFKKLPNRIKFKPLRMDDSAFEPSFQYYLTRQQWMDAFPPPLEERLIEFVDSIVSDV
ncbi:MAG: toll/interleukin-1 receptor domain-containing protein [Clostridia bacterium]|nr:toll/interleukin-1 receptor domain-containing protein [Clostridia bacterium]